jgi:hypothetical protein
MDPHNGMSICHKANIWYTSHTMYLIFKVNIYAAKYIIYATQKINLNSGNYIYKTSTVNYTKEPLHHLSV